MLQDGENLLEIREKLNHNAFMILLLNASHSGGCGDQGSQNARLGVGPLNEIADVPDVLGAEFLQQAADGGDVIAALFLRYFRAYFKRGDALTETGRQAVAHVSGD